MSRESAPSRRKTLSTRKPVIQVPTHPSSPLSRFYHERQGQCSICAEENCLLVNLSKNCKHLADICVQCRTAAIANDVKTKGKSKFECPSPECQVQFDQSEYYPLLSKPMADLVDQLLLHRMLEKDEEFRWCKSSKGCGAGQLVSNNKDLLGYYACYACAEPMCYRHSIQWHNGFTCAEYDAALAKNPDLASNTTVMEFCKPCPNEKCRTPIMKHEGCDVITCCRFGTHDCAASKGKCDHGGRNYCGQRFCWKCLGKIDVDPTSGGFIRHCKPTCQYATLN